LTIVALAGSADVLYLAGPFNRPRSSTSFSNRHSALWRIFPVKAIVAPALVAGPIAAHSCVPHWHSCCGAPSDQTAR